MLDRSRLSFPSIALIKHPPEEAFAMIAAAGFKNVDVLERMPHLSIHQDECDPATVKAAAEKHGLRISAVNSYVGGGVVGRAGAWLHHPGFEFPNRHKYTYDGFASDDPDVLETELQHVYRAIDIGAYLGARVVRIVPGDDDPEKIDKMVTWFKRCAEYAEEKGVYLAGENHDTGILGQPAKMVEFCAKVGSKHLGIIYEPYNLMEQAGYDYRKAFEVMRDHIVLVHFKDGRLDPVKRTYVPTLMGEGEFDFRWVMKRLDQIGYAGELALEYEVAEVPAEEGVKQFYTGFVRMMEDL
jgi:sugar phosphate isomerase/epimerase